MSSSVDEIIYTVNSLKKNFDKTLVLLQERMFNPKFTESSFDRIKKQTLQSFKQQTARPQQLQMLYLQNLTTVLTIF
ncbi:MAG: insulinase family protein [Chitinophagaceae bacterium]